MRCEQAKEDIKRLPINASTGIKEKSKSTIVDKIVKHVENEPEAGPGAMRPTSQTRRRIIESTRWSQDGPVL